MILKRIFEKQKYGFFVDVGAHHPLRFSNTHHFYKKGWRGINIDCNPGSMTSFNKKRRGDINLEYAISDKIEVLKFNKYREPAENTFISDFAEQNNNHNPLLETIELKTVTLDYLLNKNLPFKKVIDFLTIDVEGMDLKVLKSNNWSKYRPKIVLVEDISTRHEFTYDSEIVDFMDSVDYVLLAKTINTLIFRERFFKAF